MFLPAPARAREQRRPGKTGLAMLRRTSPSVPTGQAHCLHQPAPWTLLENDQGASTAAAFA